MYSEVLKSIDDVLKTAYSRIDSLTRAISFEYGVKTVHYYDDKQFLSFSHCVGAGSYLFVHKLHGVLIKLPKNRNLQNIRKVIDKHISKYDLVHTEQYFK